jgi:ribosomal protein L37AE/L43A
MKMDSPPQEVNHEDERVQFQPGFSMAEFMDRYGSDDKCEAAPVESRWPSGFACPACGCGHSSSFRRQGRLYFQCTACRHQCSVISGLTRR